MPRYRYVCFVMSAALTFAAGCSTGVDDTDDGGGDAPDSSTATKDATTDATRSKDATSGGEAGEAGDDAGSALDGTIADAGNEGGDVEASIDASADASADAADGGSGLHWRAYLPLTAGSNGNGAGITADVSGNGYGATYAHGVSFGAKGIVIAGGDVEIPPESSIPAVDLGGSYSVSAWVSLDDVTGWRTIVSADGTQVSNFYLQKRSDTGFFAFATTPSDTNGGAGGPCIASSAITPQASTVYHLVATRDAASGVDTIYVNGAQAGTQTCLAATGIGWQTSTFGIGHGMYAGANTDYVSGAIAGVGLIDRVLTPAEVSAIYQAGAGATVSSNGGTHGGADAGASGGGAPPAQGPCDIYQSGGTPCVAAHSTTRALYSAYAGKLYQVRRSSDNQTADIGMLTAGGFADSAAQDSFCNGATCSISILYDQSGNGNHLTSAPLGGAVNTPDTEAIATALKVTLNGHPAYGVFVTPGVGYRRNVTTGIAKGDQAEGEYMVSTGTHYNGGCCFDYGNAETSNTDTGSGHMEAIYLGNNAFWGTGSGNGPWVMSDLENGLFSGVAAGMNAGNTSVGFTFLTAMLKGSANQWAIKATNAQSGTLTQMFSGARPAGYNPMSKEGAIILGIGGDNSNSASGSFFEGAMTSGYPSDATETAVQTNITAAKYGTLP